MIECKITAKDYSGICLHCECKLKTDKEKKHSIVLSSLG